MGEELRFVALTFPDVEILRKQLAELREFEHLCDVRARIPRLLDEFVRYANGMKIEPQPPIPLKLMERPTVKPKHGGPRFGPRNRPPGGGLKWRQRTKNSQP